MVKGYILGQMADNILVISLMIKKKVMEYLNGQMEEFLMANGKMENNMEKVLIYFQIRNKKKVFGKME